MFDPGLNRRESGIEWPLWIAVAGLMIFGAAFIYSATHLGEIRSHWPWYRMTVSKQVLAYALGIGCVAVLCLFEYQRLARWALIGYWITIPLLVAVFFFPATNGAQRWIALGPLQFQPSEFAKLTFLFALANFLSRPVDELRSPALFAKAILMTLLPFMLILKEPDLGSALVFFPISLVMMTVAGVPKYLIARFVGGAVLVITLVFVDILFAPPGWWNIKLHEYQKRRLLAYFNLSFAPRGASDLQKLEARRLEAQSKHNVQQALISIGSGGIVGKGWCEGTQHQLGFLPKLGARNDFIFSVIAEEKGFLGSLTVIGLYTVVLFSGIKIAGQARDRLGRLLAVGVVTLWFTHIFINIGMNIRLMPVAGIPLPLLSAGGTSVIASLLTIGLLQNIHLYRRHY